MINRIRDIRKQKSHDPGRSGRALRPPTTAQTIGRLETGMRNLSLGWMNKIAAALGVEPNCWSRATSADHAADRRPPDRDERCRSAGRAARRDPADRARRRRGRCCAWRSRSRQGEYRAGDQLWLRQHRARGRRPADQPRCSRPAPRRALRLRPADRPQGTLVGLLPPGAGQRQIVIDNPAVAGGGGNAGPQAVKRACCRWRRSIPTRTSPRFGTFVARQHGGAGARGDWDVTVINPIGMPPVALGRYARARAMRRSAMRRETASTVHRPPFTAASRARRAGQSGADRARRAAARAPAACAARRSTWSTRSSSIPTAPPPRGSRDALGLPLSIKARGADISYWGHSGYRAAADARRPASAAGGLLAVSRSAGRRHGRDRPAARRRSRCTTPGSTARCSSPLDRRGRAPGSSGDLGLALPAGAPLLATVGALIARKGQRWRSRALALLPDAHLLLVGTGPDRGDAAHGLASGSAWRAGPLPRLARPRRCCRCCFRPPMRWCCPRPARASPTPGSRRSPAAPRW